MTLGIVIIGRNEGDRLRRCLQSVVSSNRMVIYVDSGSTDGSVELARTFGAETVTLNLDQPFTAARARNAGLNRMLELKPEIEFVQFVDGDCEVHPDWLSIATADLEGNKLTCANCGRRRERNPTASIYNHLCDLEWDTPVGPALSCGGDALMRVADVQAANGFRDSMIAGEEPELCYRLRRAGGQIHRIQAEMTLHDADIMRFGQWFRRAVRAGHAYAEGARLTASDPQGLWHREVRSTWFWGLFLPALAILGSYPTRGWGLLLLGAYPLLGIRIVMRELRRWPLRQAIMYSGFCVIAKFAHLIGMLRFHRNRLFRRPSRLIEYKHAPVANGRP